MGCSLRDEHDGRRNIAFDCFNVFGAQASCRARRDDDRVATRGVVNKDMRRTGRHAISSYCSRRDAFSGPRRACDVAERIGAEARAEDHVGTRACCGHCLVRPLAARPHRKRRSGDGLAQQRHALGAKREIRHVDAEDDDAAVHRVLSGSETAAGASGARFTPFLKMKQPYPRASPVAITQYACLARS